MRRSLLALLALPLLAPALAAQARSDQSRLSIGVGVGYNGGTDLWSVTGQPIAAQLAVDSASIGRKIRPTIGITFVGAYYPNDRFGYTGEIHLLGLGYEDRCRLETNSGSAPNAQVCNGLKGTQTPGTAVAATIGALFRPFPWNDIQPYVRANAGLLVSQQSAVRMRSEWVEDTTTIHTYFVFEDDHPASVAPVGALAAGFTAFIGRSYQMRVEAKDNFVSVEEVTGTVDSQGDEPTSRRVMRQVFSVSLAFEVVLEKRRGRRY